MRSAKIFTQIGFLVFLLLGAACASRVLQYEKSENLRTNKEYDDLMKVKEIPLPPEEKMAEVPAEIRESDEKKKPVVQEEKKKAPKQSSKPIPKGATPVSQARLPKIEDSEGFVGRRPLADPFRIGEKAVYDISYFKMSAGEMELEVGPFVEVNGAKAYQFIVRLKTSPLFSRFYSVEDSAVTYVNYETLLPYNLRVQIKESKQLAEAMTYFDFKTLKGNYWQKRFTKEKGEVEKKLEWDIQPYSQNVISSIFYLRNFTLTPGKELAFLVADDGKNITFTGKVLGKEKLATAAGTFDTVVVQPSIQADGQFKPVGDIKLWLTDDDRKILVRIESAIKIGTLKGQLKSLSPGRSL